ncbi:hypothetical protein PHISP_05253 [Aspergillus sp. HF37]|nr:hypothetical protein PHISP_05253 [Aspergillus sp. HF37]
MSDSSQQAQTQPPQPSPSAASPSAPDSQEPPGPSSSDLAASQPQPASDHPVEPKPDPEGPGAPDLDASIDQHIEMSASANPDEASGIQPADPEAGPGIEAKAEDMDLGALGNPVQEASVDALAAAAATPSKKETSLREFLGKMDDYAPIIPDAVTSHYLTLAGLPPPGHGPNQTPPHLARLLALATQKFVADIAADSYQYARIRASNSSSASNPMGSLNAASGLNAPAAAAAAGGGAAGGPAAGGGGGEGGGKGKANVHLGIQRPGFGGGGSGGSGQGRTVLTMEDLGMAVGEYGVSVKRGEFYR